MNPPTRGEAYAKLSNHLTECQDQAAILSHLHRTEDNLKDLALAQAWLNVSEQFKLIRNKLAQLAAGKLN